MTSCRTLLLLSALHSDGLTLILKANPPFLGLLLVRSFSRLQEKQLTHKHISMTSSLCCFFGFLSLLRTRHINSVLLIYVRKVWQSTPVIPGL